MDDASFRIITRAFGPFDVDCFASSTNNRCPRFYARVWCPEAAEVNAFSQPWTGGTHYLHPPVSQVAFVVKKIVEDGTVGVLVVPSWPSAVFWPILCPDGRHLARLATDMWKFQPRLRTGPLCYSRLFTSTPKFNKLAVRVDGRQSQPWMPRLVPSVCVAEVCNACH